MSAKGELKEKTKPWKSLVAGGVAGSFEAFCTVMSLGSLQWKAHRQYPAEFAKTRLQLQRDDPKTVSNPVKLLRSVIKEDGIRGVYQGCSTLIIGSAFKAGVRFVAFDSIRRQFADADGKVSGFGGLISGFGAGFLESVFAVTPFETIKTALVDDAKKGPARRYHGFIHGTASLYRDLGFRGIYRGLVPVTLRQSANSTVRMGSYSYMTGIVRARQGLSPKDKLPGPVTFGIGAVAGVITVYTTMPFDTVKTRMQSLRARELYKSTPHCAVKVFREEGLLVFWSGAVPRLARLIFSGGIIFTVYEQVMTVLN